MTAFGALFTIFAAMAVALASVGLYATVAQAVTRRTQEIGIRMAIGAGRFDIFRLVLAQGIRQVVIGFAAGLPLSIAATRILRGTLVGVSPGDPVAFLSALVVLMVAGILGCAIPSMRAIRVEPLVALRLE